MNSRRIILLGLLAAAVAHGQGTVVFNNLASTNYNIRTNHAPWTEPGLMSGTNAYRVALYAAPGLDAHESSLTLVGLATNAPVPGKFNGGGTFVLPAGYSRGGSLTFQLRAWSFAGGLSYEEFLAHYASGGPHRAYGGSALGTTTAGGGFVPPGALFGTSPGLISSGFVIMPPIPEPSSTSLIVLASLALLAFRRRKRGGGKFPSGEW